MKNEIDILFVIQSFRVNLINYLKEEFQQFCILTNEKFTIKDDNLAIFYYQSYKTPELLLLDLKPRKIVFFEVFDFQQIALCIAANRLNISTIFLDHGLMGGVEFYDEVNKKNIVKNLTSRMSFIFKEFKSILSNRFFFFSSFKYIRGFNEKKKFIELYFFIEFVSSYHAFKLNYLNDRIPKRFILFNKKNVEIRNALYHFSSFPEIKIDITGVPGIPLLKKQKQLSKNILFITQPFTEQKLHGWNKKHNDILKNRLAKFASENNNLNVFIKLHPLSNISLWTINKIPPNLFIIDKISNGEENSFYSSFSLILGFNSTLMLWFLSNRFNVVTLNWHPDKSRTNIIDNLEKISHISNSMNDLDKNFNIWFLSNKIHHNPEEYEKFLENYNPNFDGKASKKILNILES